MAMRLFTVLYLGPDQLLPLASGVATVIGFALIFGRYIISFVRRILGLSKKDTAALSAATDPATGMVNEPLATATPQPESDTRR
jgi:hypothetical protein